MERNRIERKDEIKMKIQITQKKSRDQGYRKIKDENFQRKDGQFQMD